MVFISISKFAEQYLKNNPNENKEQITKSLTDALHRKNKGTKCCICGAPIWAAGSAVSGSDMCFTCITGESDDSEDYEITE